MPIEEIVEFDLSMTVIPVDGLRADVGVDAFLSSDLDRIFVDERAMRVSLPRFRFSLAHEVGHYCFAGLVLAPTAPLRQAFEHALEEAVAIGVDAGLVQEHPVRQRFVQGLADRFEVSAETMERRLVKDGHLAELLAPETDG